MECMFRREKLVDDMSFNEFLPQLSAEKSFKVLPLPPWQLESYSPKDLTTEGENFILKVVVVVSGQDTLELKEEGKLTWLTSTSRLTEESEGNERRRRRYDNHSRRRRPASSLTRVGRHHALSWFYPPWVFFHAMKNDQRWLAVQGLSCGILSTRKVDHWDWLVFLVVPLHVVNHSFPVGDRRPTLLRFLVYLKDSFSHELQTCRNDRHSFLPLVFLSQFHAIELFQIHYRLYYWIECTAMRVSSNTMSCLSVYIVTKLNCQDIVSSFYSATIIRNRNSESESHSTTTQLMVALEMAHPVTYMYTWMQIRIFYAHANVAFGLKGPRPETEHATTIKVTL